MSLEIELDYDKRMQKKLKDIFEATLEKGPKFDGNFSEIDFFNLAGKAASVDMLYSIATNSLCMFNCVYEKEDSVLMVFSIPINTKSDKEKHISERIMNIIKNTEECFTTLDYVNSKEIKEDKFIYLTMIKKIGKLEQGEI